MANIKFGTDGWRDIVGENFTETNVETVTHAIGKYVWDTFSLNKKILIGYDPRNLALEFAQQCAHILSEAGFDVLISDKIIPTPVLAYSAKFLDACAIMFTASHNPPEYLGMKFIPDYAGPATSEITDSIVANLGVKLDLNSSKKPVLTDFKPSYYKHMSELINFAAIKTLDEKIIFDGLYSATIGFFDELLVNKEIPFDSFHMVHDPNFGGGMPEPKPKFLSSLIEAVKSSENAVGFANDGDGDRFGVINERGEWVSPNEVIAILLLHLKQNRNFSGPLVKTVGASLFLNKVAEKLGVEVIETAVGFKHVGEAMRKYNPIIGGEESGGLSIQGHIPEKDGILANLLILEAMATSKKSLCELQEEVKNIAGCEFFNDRVDVKLDSQERIKTMLERFAQCKSLGRFEVTKCDKKDGVKLYLGDNSWILMRASGTEPLLRIYFESDNILNINELKENIKDAGFAELAK